MDYNAANLGRGFYNAHVYVKWLLLSNELKTPNKDNPLNHNAPDKPYVILILVILLSH